MSEVSVINNQQQGQGEEEAQLELPPGFRFHPTDEEVVSHYLIPKALNMLFTCLVIADVDLNNCEPWDLPGKAKMGEKEWYFFWHKGRKYPTGTRTNRATPTGYWKATGRDKEIFRGRGVLVGMKKTLVFYLGRAPHGEKTPWVMHEFRLEGKMPPHLPPGAKDEWAVCRVFNKDLPAKQPGHGPSPALTAGFESFEPLPFNHGFFDDSIDLPPLVNSPFPDDFTDIKQGAASSSAGTSSSSGVKTEQQAVQNLTTNTHSAYFFSMPATTSRPGYSHSSAGNDQRPSAIRAPCNPVALAPPPNEDVASSRLPYPELDDDLLFPFSEDFIGDYSDMWKV